MILSREVNEGGDQLCLVNVKEIAYDITRSQIIPLWYLLSNLKLIVIQEYQNMICIVQYNINFIRDYRH